MSPFPLPRSRAAFVLPALAVLAAASPGQRDPAGAPQQPGAQQQPGAPGSREATWPAPTAADWQKPCLVHWQRTWDDALAVSKQTGKPIMVCINMDGEIASEHYAGVRYRQPGTAALFAPYVCVIASVYRHNPRDYDEQGRRILCPRFGSVTCGEHIAIEPILFEKFMDGRRIAPRHIMVELDGSETYDVYYAFDTQSVFDAIRKGIADRARAPAPILRGDVSILDRIDSRDNEDRSAVEAAWLQADRAQRAAMLDRALALGGDAPVELLRLALFGLDVDLAQRARQGLAGATAPAAVGLIEQALRVAMPDADRQALLGALDRLGAASPRARTLATVHRGLANRSSAVDVAQWSAALGGGTYAPPDRQNVLDRVDRTADAAKTHPGDAEARLALAEATLAQALAPSTAQALASEPGTAAKYQRLLFEDARRAAFAAQQLGAKGWRLESVLAVASYYLGDVEDAYRRAEAALGGMPDEPTGICALNALALFAEARQVAIADAVRRKKDWPAQWLTDVHLAYSVIARHPLGTDRHVVAHYDFVQALGGAASARKILDAGLQRFPDSALLHDRLRACLLEEKGPEGLEAAYAAMLGSAQHAANLRWFAGYASLVAAEFHRRHRDGAEAEAAYGRAIACYEQDATDHPGNKDGDDHYVAMALAGRARVRLERDDLDGALHELLQCFARRPASAATLDGLSISPADTARTLRARLVAAARSDLLAQLDAALARLDPELLQLPAYEGQGPRPGPGRRPPRRRGGR